MNSEKKKWLVYLAIFFCVVCYDISIHAQQTQDGKLMDKVILAEQIPETELASMSTEQLIQKYLNSRYPRYIFLYPHDVNYTFEKAYNDFNGLRELLNRPDIVKSLINLYKGMDPDSFNEKWSLADKGGFSFTFVFVEILLSRESILESCSKEEIKILLSELLEKHEKKIKHPELYSMFDIQFNAFCIGKLLNLKGKENGISQSLIQVSGMNDFFNGGILRNREVIPIVIQKAKEFLNVY